MSACKYLSLPLLAISFTACGWQAQTAAAVSPSPSPTLTVNATPTAPVPTVESRKFAEVKVTLDAQLCPSKTSSNLDCKHLRPDEGLEVLQEDGEYVFVRRLGTQGPTGWVEARFIRPAAAPPPTSATSSTLDTSPDEITRRRYEECVRQRTAFGVDTSPCDEWSKER